MSKSCMRCIHLKDNSNNDGFKCKFLKQYWKYDTVDTAESCPKYKEQKIIWGINKEEG